MSRALKIFLFLDVILSVVAAAIFYFQPTIEITWRMTWP